MLTKSAKSVGGLRERDQIEERGLVPQCYLRRGDQKQPVRLLSKVQREKNKTYCISRP